MCAVYRGAIAAKETIRTVSIDEMSGIQALERIAPSLPMTPGRVERREFEYIRHGTQALIAAFDVATGQVIGTVADSRSEAEFVAFLKALFATAPKTMGWRVVCDNLDTHKSEAWCGWWPLSAALTKQRSAAKGATASWQQGQPRLVPQRWR